MKKSVHAKIMSFLSFFSPEALSGPNFHASLSSLKQMFQIFILDFKTIGSFVVSWFQYTLATIFHIILEKMIE